MWRSHTKIAAVAMSAVLVGCASDQLNYNSLDLAASSDGLITSQILSNLSKFQSNPYAIPAQVSIPSGSATTTNAITPTFGAPIGQTVTSTLANSAAAPLFNAATRTHTTAGGTVGLSLADQWSQNWTLTPLEDPDQLLRLRAIYRFGAGQTDESNFACEYPLVQRAQEVSAMPSGQSAKASEDGTDGSVPTTTSKIINYVYSRDIQKNCGKNLPAVGMPDPAFLRPPTCVICDKNVDLKTTAASAKTVHFLGTLKGNDITITKIIRGNGVVPSWIDEGFVGGKISGMCIVGEAVVKSINSATQIRINPAATCNSDSPMPFTITSTVAPKSNPSTHVLEVNKLLSNKWLWHPDEPLPANPLWLGHYEGRDLYMTPREVSREEYSNFVLFVLTATLQSTSGAFGTSGKGSPQKGGAPLQAQRPAAPDFLLIQ
jgi:hypothetical protein